MSQLRNGVEFRRQMLIQRLNQEGVFEAQDERPLEVLTLTDLEILWRRTQDELGERMVLR